MSTALQIPDQAVIPAAVVGYAFLAVMAAGLIVVTVWAAVFWWNDRRRTTHAGAHDVGPDALRLLEDLDGHLDGMLAADPNVAAGFARLDAAMRERQGEARDA